MRFVIGEPGGRCALLAAGLAVIAFAVASGVAFAQAEVHGLDIWYFDEPGRTVYKVSSADGSVLTSFALPVPLASPAGLAVSTQGGATILRILDTTSDLIYRLDAETGDVIEAIAAPSVDAIGLGAACVVPVGFEELFVVANDADPGALYWINPALGTVLNRCTIGATDIRDATAFALGNNGTGVCYLRDLDPGGTEIACINKLTCALIFAQTYPWEGWGLGNRTTGATDGTATDLYASDLGADIVHVLSAVDGTELRQIPTAVSGASVRGVGGDSTCPQDGGGGDRCFGFPFAITDAAPPDIAMPFRCCGTQLTVADLGGRFSEFVDRHRELMLVDDRYRKDFSTITQPYEERASRLSHPIDLDIARECERIATDWRHALSHPIDGRRSILDRLKDGALHPTGLRRARPPA